MWPALDAAMGASAAAVLAAGLCVHLLNGGASGFVTWAARRTSRVPPSPRAAADASSPWEEGLRREAADALVPVFFPKSRNDNASMEPKPITAEAALKKVLRKKYQRRRATDQSKQESNACRGRLAALILGTSVMRLRHWYAVACPNPTACTLVPYPLDPSLLELIREHNYTAEEVGDSLEPSMPDDSSQEMSLVRAMVDEHSRYLSSQNDTSIIQTISQNNGPALALSIQYSLPSFLTAALLSHYGYNQTMQICSLMNEPGPITLRRNAIRFPGTDVELCTLLWEEGIHAEPLASLLEGGNRGEDALRHSSRPIMSESLDGSSRYVMRSSSVPGSVMPPEGAIQITPRQGNATTSVEQRRSNKSIWSMIGWQNGYFEVQDTGSQLIVQSLELSPGESVLDYCAGNGGKTFAIASALMSAGSQSADPSGVLSHIVAYDVVEDRLRQILGSLSRVGFVAKDDGAAYNETIYMTPDDKCSIQIASSSDLERACTSSPSFDAVLVDAPCSSSGVLRRRPSQRWDLTEEKVFGELPDVQLEILQKAASFVGENEGRLVY